MIYISILLGTVALCKKKRLSIVFERKGSAATADKFHIQLNIFGTVGTLPKKRLSIVFERKGSAATADKSYTIPIHLGLWRSGSAGDS